MMNDYYCEEQTEHDKVTINSDNNFTIIRKNDNERDVLYKQERKAKRDYATLRLRIKNEKIRRRRINTA